MSKAATINASADNGTAHPPLPFKPMTMEQWANRARPSLAKVMLRLFEVKRVEREVV
jgi:hypothetical protein